MKLISVIEADILWADPVVKRYEALGQEVPEDIYAVFPKMRASFSVLAFSPGYLVKLSDWWAKWKFVTGFKYVPGSGMCESGTKVLLGHIHESLMPFRGTGSVPQETLDEAKAMGVSVPEERLGDFAPGAIELGVVIPKGVSLNGVTDGGHSTPGIILHEPDGKLRAVACEPDGKLRAVVWEWQNERWMDWDEAVANGVELRNYAD